MEENPLAAISWQRLRRSDVQEQSHFRSTTLRQLSLIAVVWSLLGLNFCLAQCDVPIYKKGKVYEGSKSEIVRQISIAPESFAPQSLVCLAKHLREIYSDRSKATFTIYDDEVAAKTDMPLTVEADFKDYERAQHRHAVYAFDRSAHSEELTLEPNIRRWREFSTKLDLATTATQSCNLHINDRCLLAFHDIDYPWEASGKKNSGTVVLSATIEPNGRLADVRVVDSESDNPAA